MSGKPRRPGSGPPSQTSARADDRASRPDPLLPLEDRALWEHVARTIAPERRRGSRVPEVGPPDAASQPGTTARLHARLSQESHVPSGDRQSPSRPGKPFRPDPKQHAVPPLADFDRKSSRRLRSGRIEIEARLDLHGMTQDEAHRALRSFLAGCQARGVRWTLVITGKGRPLGREDVATVQPFAIERERGILRRNVPRWLAEPDIRPLVVSYAPAALHHGGEGALYVQLRTRHRTGRHD